MEYLSCEWIENRMVLDLEQIKFCCIPHSGNKGYVPMLDYKGGPFPVEGVREARRTLIEENNSPGPSPCKGCHFLKRKEWKQRTEKDPLFGAVYISTFSICNLRCRYCFVFLYEGSATSNVPGYDLLSVFRELIEGGQLDDDTYIEWGGGEPTIVKGFAELEQMLLRQGYPQQVHTSAVAFSPQIEEGLRSGHVRAVTSVDAGTRDTYHKVKGRDRFDVVWEHVSRYAATGGDMTAKYILRQDNSDEENVHAFVERCKKAGVRRIVLTPDFREIAQNQIGEHTLYAFALMVDEAQKAGIEALIRDEYLKPADMKKAMKYIRMPDWKEQYRRTREAAEAKAAAAAAERARRHDESPEETRAALTGAEDLLARSFEVRRPVTHPFQLLGAADDREVLQLLARQTEVPDPELKGRLSELVRTKDLPGRLVMDQVTGFGFTDDGWTQNGGRGYLHVDATQAKKPVVPWLWVACYADPSDLPLQVSFKDGVHEPIVYKFLRPEQIRISLPEVAPGDAGIFVCETDRSWTPRNGDPRTLGVQVQTRL